MKFKSIIGSVLLVAASVMLISVAPAQAGECSAEDPCHTYAMVDGSGIVTNVIVCQPSVCGSGFFAGSRVVPQVAANPVTHQNQAAYLANSDGTPVRESNGVFTITDNVPTFDGTVVVSDTTSTHLTSVLEPGVTKSFTFSDTIRTPDGRPKMTIGNIDNSIGATLSVTELSNSDTPTVISQESITFDERQTEEYVELELMIQELTKLLANWSWFRSSLFGWFL
jgi:hypothetical protein